MDGLTRSWLKNLHKSSHAIDIADYDANARYLIGWPGYQTSRNKSGLAYAETQAESAHMQGLFIRWLFTGKFRTRNPIYLLWMLLIGAFFGVIPLVLILHEVLVRGEWAYLLLFISAPNTVGGLFLIWNAILSLVDRKGKTITGDYVLDLTINSLYNPSHSEVVRDQ